MALDGKVQGYDLFGKTPPTGVNMTEDKSIEPIVTPIKQKIDNNDPSPTPTGGSMPKAKMGSGLNG